MSEIIVYDAATIVQDEWRQLQAISRGAFACTLDRSQAEVDELVGWSDPKRYAASHVDPNTEVGKRFFANQGYSHPRVRLPLKIKSRSVLLIAPTMFLAVPSGSAKLKGLAW